MAGHCIVCQGYITGKKLKGRSKIVHNACYARLAREA